MRKGWSDFARLLNRVLVCSRFGRLLNSSLLGGVAGISVTAMGFFISLPAGQTWAKNNQDLILKALGPTAIFFVFAHFLRFLGAATSSSNRSEGAAIADLFVSVGRIVQCKINRFRQVVPDVTTRRDLFGTITQPEVQIRAILSEMNDFLCDQHLLNEQEIDATVLRLDHASQTWSYIINSHAARKRTDPTVLMSSNSAAATAHKTGNYSFYPSKREASKTSSYLFSKHEEGDGSIFSYPVLIEATGFQQEYVITFATYGHCLCDPSDESAKNAISFIFREFCRRVELELILLTIKDCKAAARSAKTVPARPRKAKHEN